MKKDNQEKRINWSQRQRLEYIERLLYWRGWINRDDLCERFETSPPQATNDLVAYAAINESGISYNVRKRRYESTANMRPAMIEPNMQADFNLLSQKDMPAESEAFLITTEYPNKEEKPKLQYLTRAAYPMRRKAPSL